jgi:hypothetical protein
VTSGRGEQADKRPLHVDDAHGRHLPSLLEAVVGRGQVVRGLVGLERCDRGQQCGLRRQVGAGE